MNKSMKEIHSMLIAQVVLMYEKVGSVADADLVRAFANEIQELNHRINLIQRFLFIEESKSIADKLPVLRTANRKLDEAVREIESITKVVESTTKFLTVVDQVIDIAKLLV